MNEMETIWHNGRLVPWRDCQVHVLSHVIHYGTGVFEGIRVYKTVNEGSAVFELSKHIERLIYSAKALGIEIPYSQKELENAVCQTVYANQLEEGYIRPVVFYGYEELGIVPKENTPIEVAIACWPWGKYLSSNQADLVISDFIRIHPKSTVADAKIAGHYINSLLAKLAVKNSHYNEVLLLDSDGYVAETSSSNIFIIKDNTVYTTKEGTILVGITRNAIIDWLKHQGYQVVETLFKPEDIINADEAFICGTAVEVVPVRSLNDQLINDGKIGSVTKKVQKAYQDMVTGNDNHYQSMLTYIDQSAKV